MSEIEKKGTVRLTVGSFFHRKTIKCGTVSLKFLMCFAQLMKKQKIALQCFFGKYNAEILRTLPNFTEHYRILPNPFEFNRILSNLTEN